MIPDISVLCNDHDGSTNPVPKISDILSITTVEEVNNLTDSASVTYKARNFVPIPPFLLIPIIEAMKESNDAKKILIATVLAIKEFDTAHSGDSEYKEKAKSKCKDFMLWLYLVAKESNAIKPVPFNSVSSEKVAEKLSRVTEKCLEVSREYASRELPIHSSYYQQLSYRYKGLCSLSNMCDFVHSLKRNLLLFEIPVHCVETY